MSRRRGRHAQHHGGRSGRPRMYAKGPVAMTGPFDDPWTYGDCFRNLPRGSDVR
jgi:hypothetical protein